MGLVTAPSPAELTSRKCSSIIIMKSSCIIKSPCETRLPLVLPTGGGPVELTSSRYGMLLCSTL